MRDQSCNAIILLPASHVWGLEALGVQLVLRIDTDRLFRRFPHVFCFYYLLVYLLCRQKGSTMVNDCDCDGSRADAAHDDDG